MSVETRSGQVPSPAMASEQKGRLVVRGGRWQVELGVGDEFGPQRVVDLEWGRVVADEAYCYDLTVGFGDRDLPLQRVLYLDRRSETLADGGLRITLVGRADFGLLGPTDIEIEHTIILPASAPWLEEQIAIVHRFGRDRHPLRSLRFGFRKTLFDRDRSCWLDGADRLQIVPVPHRRRWGQVVDHLVSSYSAADLMPANWSGEQLPGRGAEAWLLLGEAERGYLVTKYNRERIEFALVDGEFVLAPSKRESAYYRTFNPRVAGGANLCLRFGGIGRYHSHPEFAAELGREAALVFGPSRLYPVEGDWQAGYATYKAHLVEHGHALPPDFDPPLHWNELYNLGWRGGDNAPLQRLPELEQEAAIARDIGAEAFYFDPVWDVVEGSTIWDEARLGPLPDFVRMMRERYGLSTSLHLMMHTKSLEDDPAIYRRKADGSIDLWEGLYTGGHICGGSKAWQALKTERLLKLAEAGVSFFMFDFLNYTPPGSGALSHRQPGSACWDPSHGHEVPMTMQTHAEGILAVIQAVKQRYPNLLIEAHDRVTGGLQDYHPLYYQHGLPHSFDENWGFEYMWDPFFDLLSGKALSLYEYNLAYDIPLYLHIHCGQDNEQMLAFWWYASTCRHLGIGGVRDPQSPLYRALKAAVAEYRALKPFFTRGRFVGLDLLAHAHVLPERDQAVILLFNLTSQPIERTLTLRPEKLGLQTLRTVSGAAMHAEGEAAVLRATVAPLAPLLVRVNIPSST